VIPGESSVKKVLFVLLILGGQQLFGELVKKVFVGSDGTPIPYMLQIPETVEPGEQYPLVLCLHGAGGRGIDNEGRSSASFKTLSSPVVQKRHPSFLLVPQCPEGEQWVDTPWAKGSYDLSSVPISNQLKAVLELLAAVRSEFAVDATRIYAAGLSMGGFGTWDLILRNPDLFAAAVPVCGSGDPSRASRLHDLPVWVFHGDADPVVPVQGSRDMVDALKKAGNQSVRYTEFPGVGHGSWGPAWQEPELVNWLFGQQNSTGD
jgi:predicted peptidase